MNRRTLGKQVEFSYSTLFHEDVTLFQDENIHLESLSDEDIFENKAEILWSRDKNAFHWEKNKDSFETFPEMTGRTVSSCSWQNDDFDMKSTSKVNASLAAIDDALFENKKDPCITDEIYKECCEWAYKFPYLRIKGKQVIKPLENDIVHISRSITEENANLLTNNSSLCFLVEGKKMPVHSLDKSSSKASCDSSLNFINVASELYEEVFEEHGQYEELLALDVDETTPSSIELKTIQDKIVETLALQIWPNIMDTIQKNLTAQNEDSDSLHLPEIITPLDNSKALFLQRPRTEGTNLSSLDFPKLDSILRVSPKILQSREEKKRGNSAIHLRRPNSEMSTICQNSITNTSTKHGSIVSSNASIFNKNKKTLLEKEKSNKLKKNTEETDDFLFLPALEEDISYSTKFIRGVPIKPEIRLASKFHFISRVCETPRINTKSEIFLPPIDSKESLPANNKLNKNVFTSDGARSSFSEKIKSANLFSKKNVNSRPNTSTLRNVSRNNSDIQLKDVLPFSNKHSKIIGIDENSLTLFPIVTSLVPHKEKNSSIIKKEEPLSAFIGGKK